METTSFNRCSFDQIKEVSTKELSPQLLQGFACNDNQCTIAGKFEELQEIYLYPMLEESGQCELHEFREFKTETSYRTTIRVDNATIKAMGLPKDTMQNLKREDIRLDFGERPGFGTNFEVHEFYAFYSEIIPEDILYVQDKSLKVKFLPAIEAN